MYIQMSHTQVRDNGIRLIDQFHEIRRNHKIRKGLYLKKKTDFVFVIP